MGYRSQVALKTTTEGWILMKKLNDSIEKEEDKPLAYMTVEQTPTGFYKISHTDIKWYDGYSQVENFNLAMDRMTEQDIPFVFIRIGEDVDDIEVRNNWTDDMPDTIETFEPQTDIYDEDAGAYKTIMEDGKEVEYKDLFTPKPTSDTRDIDAKMKGIMFDLFDEYEEYDDIKDALRSLNSEGSVTDSEYDWALEHWDRYLTMWEEIKSHGI